MTKLAPEQKNKLYGVVVLVLAIIATFAVVATFLLPAVQPIPPEGALKITVENDCDVSIHVWLVLDDKDSGDVQLSYSLSSSSHIFAFPDRDNVRVQAKFSLNLNLQAVPVYLKAGDWIVLHFYNNGDMTWERIK